MDEIIANQDARGLLPGWGGRISAALVWDGTEEVRIPKAMGEPRADQMQGTARERLVELAGRVCYDSLGKGRSSADYAKHLIDVGHLSVLEHAAFTLEIQVGTEACDVLSWLEECFNRPGLYLRPDPSFDGRYRITLNLRHVLEWGKYPMLIRANTSEEMRGIAPLSALDYVVGWHGQKLAPSLVPVPEFGAQGRVVEPETDEEKWITLYLTGSRGWSHELVRHGDWTAISQRSTRYVDESESEWVLHPLIAKFLQEIPKQGGGFAEQAYHATEGLEDVGKAARREYFWLVSKLEPWLVSKGVDKVSARKQARGAARGLLGNALETEVIFSASVVQWRHVLRMRAADAADAEIRLGFAEAVLPCLRASRYADRFADLELGPAGDGIGRSLRGGGAK